MMPRTDTTQATANVARAAIVAAMQTFVTATLPSLHVTTAAAIAAMDPAHPTLDGSTPEGAFYRACAAYTNALIAKGTYAGPPLRYP